MVSPDPPRDLMSSCQASGNHGTTGVMQPAASDLGAASRQTLHTPHLFLFQVKEEPMDDAPCLDEPVFISLDDEDDDELSALLGSFTSSREQPSLPGLIEAPVYSSEDRVQLGSGGSSSSRPCSWDTATAIEGCSEQSLEAAMTPVVIMYDKVNIGGSSSGADRFPWSCDSSTMSISQEQAPSQFQPSQNNTLLGLFQQQQPNPNLPMPQLLSSEDWQKPNSSYGGTSVLSQQQQAPPQWQPTQNNTFVQQQPNNLQLQLLHSIDSLQLNSSSGGSNNPWNSHDSMSMSQAQHQAPQLDQQFFSGCSESTPQWQSSPNNTFTGLIQQQQNLQMPLLPSFKDKLQLNSTDGPGACSAAGTDSGGPGWEAMMSAPTAVASEFDISIAGGNMAIGQQGWPATPPAPCNNYSVFGTGGGGSSSSSVWENMPLNLSTSSMEYSNSLTNLRLGGMEKPSRFPPRQPSLKVGAGASSSISSRGAHGDFFSEAEMEAINKDKLLKKIVSTDPQRVKRILNNRVSVAKFNARKINRAVYLQRQSEALQMDSMLLSTQVLSHKATTSSLNAQNREMRHKLQIMNEQACLNEALSGQLNSEIQSLRILQLNMLRANGVHDPMRNQMAGEGNSNMNNSSGLHQLPTQVQPLQHEQQPHQAIDDEFVMGQQ